MKDPKNGELPLSLSFLPRMANIEKLCFFMDAFFLRFHSVFSDIREDFMSSLFVQDDLFVPLPKAVFVKRMHSTTSSIHER